MYDIPASCHGHYLTPPSPVEYSADLRITFYHRGPAEVTVEWSQYGRIKDHRDDDAIVSAAWDTLVEDLKAEHYIMDSGDIADVHVQALRETL